MLTSLKKVTALAGALAIIAMNTVSLTVNAAAVNDGVAALATNDITITSTSISGANVTVRVEKDGVAIPGVQATISGNIITVVNPDGVAAGGVNAGYYVITFNTDANVFGSATFNNSSTYNKVNVTATVVPTLSLALTTNNASLGVLTPGTFSASGSQVNVDLTYSTNASTGLVVAMASTGLKDTAVGHEINATPFAAQASNSGKYTVATAPGAGAAIATNGSLAVAANQDVASAIAPVNNVTTNVRLGAEITNVTKAGNYTDTLTFTVTGKF